jgi:hypothetical protein
LTPIATPIRRRPEASTAGEYRVARSAPVEHRGQPVPPVVQQRERLLGGRPGRQRERVSRHHLPQLGEPVHPQAVGFGGDADRPPVLDHDHGAVRPLGQQAQRVARGVPWPEGQRGLDHQIP